MGFLKALRTLLKLIYCSILALYLLCTHQYKTLCILLYRANGAKHSDLKKGKTSVKTMQCSTSTASFRKA